MRREKYRMMRELKKFVLLALILLLLFSDYIHLEIGAPAPAAGAHYSGLPKVDEILYKMYPGGTPDTVVDEFLIGVTDWIEGPARKDLYNKVFNAGHKISPMDPMAEFGFIAINCRDYKEESGEPNMPLNDSSFRIALSYIYGVDDKQADIYARIGAPWTFAIDNPIPPAQEPWYDDNVKMPPTSDNDTAWTILQANGYYVNTTDNRLYCNGTKIRDMTLDSFNCGYWSWGPGAGFVRNFNEFIAYIGASGPTMTVRLRDFSGTVNDLLVHHNYDFIAIGMSNQGRFVDWTYDLLHSSNIGNMGWNFVGIVDPKFDEWTEIILTSLNETEIIEVASKLQQKFVYELMPWFPVHSTLEFCTVAREADPPAGRGELMNVISMPYYGSRNDWSWMTMHWNYSWPGGTVRTALGDEPHTMNPYTEDTPDGWQMLDRAITGLIMAEPVNLTDIPWIATDYEIKHWTSIPELGIANGSAATFWLRQDVYWHDGKSVTAYDCVNNIQLLRKYHPGRYSSVLANLVYEEAEGPYKFNIYFSKPSLYYAIYVAETALLTPKHITDLVEQQVEDGILVDFFDWAPCDNDYRDLTGEEPPAEYPFMKQLVGAGPFVFDYYDRSTSWGRVVRYEEFFVSAPVIGAVVGDYVNYVDPLTNEIPDVTYKVLVQNFAAKNNSAGGELVPVTVDVKVYEDGILAHTETDITLDPWNFTYLGPYITDALGCGSHNITVEIYEDTTLIHTYEHKLLATLEEDINLDLKVNVKDIFATAKAFGSVPGHSRWDPTADVNSDFKVNVKDIFTVAKQFGWVCLQIRN
jgi:ABC-type transport system substrate-binding protein